MSLLYTDVEDALRTSVRAALSDHCGWTRVLARVEGAEPGDRSLWRLLAGELGVAALAVPEKAGGAGAGWSEVAVVLEELGRFVAPVPFLGSAVVATRALLFLDATGPLADLAGGERTAALAVPFSTPPGSAADPQWTVEVDRDGRLAGTVTSVADALTADLLLVPTAAGLYAVDTAGPGTRRQPVPSLDPTRPLCDVILAGADGELLGPAEEAVDAALLTGGALLASEQLGVASWCLDSTVEYLRNRYQFGRPVGSFQALKHRLADLWVAVTEARAVARHAAGLAGRVDREARIAAALAQAHCGEVALRAAEDCVQLHGGIGFTWEHPTHLYLKRAKSTSLAFGTADRHRSALASLVDLPG